MRALIVLAHPEIRSFNVQLASLAAATLSLRGYAVEVSNLYAMGFDPILAPGHHAERQDPHWYRPRVEQRFARETRTTSPDVRGEIEKLDRADLLLLQYPVWWHQPPAMLKGWLDRVLTHGGAPTIPACRDRGRRAMVSVTTDAADLALALDGRSGGVGLTLWPMCLTLHDVGYAVLPPFVASGVRDDAHPNVGGAAPVSLGRHKEALRRRILTLEWTEPLQLNEKMTSFAPSCVSG